MIDVPELLSRLGIDYQKRGTKVLARCPNPDHPDRSASWMIRDEPGDPRHATHRCLACDFRGRPVDLVMVVLGVDFRAARDFLAGSEKRSPLALDISVEVKTQKRSAMLPPDDVAFAPLDEWPPVYRQYLLEREVDAAQVDRWGIGHTAESQDRSMRGRVWLPARDRFGSLQGWTARAIANRHDKYKSASLADGADPRVLFGEVFWPAETTGETLYLVEGPFDALALDRELMFVAALRGSDLDPGQASKLAGWGQIIVATDPDAAGEKAALLLQGLKRWVSIRYVSLPVGTDVAKLAVDNRDELLTRLGEVHEHIPRHG